MADFSNTEKINASWKHLFGILGTSNSVPGKSWYEEAIDATHIVVPQDIWSDVVPYAANRAQAQANSGSVVEDRSDGHSIVLVSNGTDWDISATFEPKTGYQISDVHPNPSYVKSITNVVNNGGGSYTITLNNNSGVFAGSAVLHRRIFLTVDLASNGLAWFSKYQVGSSFSNTIVNFLQPQKFGIGYSVRLYQANGVEILTTHGAWIFNWQKGCLLFAKGFSADELSYAKPLYVEAFRYIGSFGVGDSISAGNLNDTLRFDGSNYVPNSSLQSDGIDVYVENRLTVSGSVVLPSGVAPSGIYAPGDGGEIRWDNNFVYVKTDLGWARTDLRYF